MAEGGQDYDVDEVEEGLVKKRKDYYVNEVEEGLVRKGLRC